MSGCPIDDVCLSKKLCASGVAQCDALESDDALLMRSFQRKRSSMKSNLDYVMLSVRGAHQPEP
jgi:hypothetical protein